MAYFGIAKVGLSFSIANDIVSAVWPPSGLALAAVVVFGYRIWPAIAVGAFVANATGDSSLATAAGIASGNAIAAVTAGHLLSWAGFDIRLKRVRDVVALAILGAAASTAVNASIGVASLWADGVVQTSGLWSFWRVWWLGDLTGVLLVAPALLILAGGIDRSPHRARIAEASALTAVLVVVTLLVLDEGVTLAYPVFPLIVLAAMRFRQPGAVIAALVVSTLAVIYTANGEGPFIGGSADTELLRAQVFVALAAMTGLLVAAMRSEWEQAEFALARLAESKSALAEAQRLAHIGSWEWDIVSDQVSWSDELYRIFGVEPDLFGTSYENYLDRIHPEDRERVDTTVRNAVEQAKPFRFEHRLTHPDGEIRILNSRGRVICDAGGRPLRMLGTAQDVTERKLAEQKLEHQALHDPLTGLPNRILFLDRLEHALARARRPRTGLAVFFCDIDDFKNVNDSLGHEAGDKLLVALPPRLREALRDADTLARFGGDEFVILCEDLDSATDAMRTAERIARSFTRPFELDGREHHLSVSVGVVFVEEGQAGAPEVLRDADAAMYRAKGSGRGRFELFDARMRARLVERLQTEADLRRAITEGQLRLLYQPVLSLEHGRLVGAEALVRWDHPERGLLEPSEFVELAEDSGLIVPLGTWVIGEACRQAAAWGKVEANSARPWISINLSPRQVSRSNVAELVAQALETTGVDPALVELEITENVLLEEGDTSMATLLQLKRMGVRLVLDDFGTGYSSLSNLKRFPIDALKIDREFIDGLGAKPEDTAIVSAVLSMARAMKVEVVAEGVESHEQLDWLREHGCPLAQGNILSPPLSAEEIELMVQRRDSDYGIRWHGDDASPPDQASPAAQP